MREDILALLEKDSRLTTADIAERLGINEADIADELGRMVDERIICGYHTLINWDKTDRDFVTALIEVKVIPQRGLGFDSIAEKIYLFDEVEAVYLMSGGFDLAVMIEGRSIKDIAYFVYDRLSTLESVQATATHFVLKKYKDKGIILSGDMLKDERMLVSP